MKKLFVIMLPLLLASCGGKCLYSVPETPWDLELGNHRAVLKVSAPAEAVNLELDWRRHDTAVVNKRFLIISEEGDTIPNVLRKHVDREKCSIVFGPVKKAGIYHFYYMPRVVEPKGSGGWTRGAYIPREKAPDAAWAGIAASAKANAEVKGIQSINNYNTFYPMEVIATKAETAAYDNSFGQPWYVFPEDRTNPIRMLHDIPQKWLDIKPGESFSGSAAPNEYYTFQIGVWAAGKAVEGLAYKASDLVSGGNVIPASSITCFNLEGVGAYGDAFKKNIDVAAGDVQALWFGVDIAENQKPGTYRGTVTVSAADGKSADVNVSIKVGGQALEDRGDAELWRHSRLRWLNSQVGVEDEPTLDYEAVSVSGLDVSVAGKTLTVDSRSGLPAQLTRNGKNVLSAPLKFEVETASGKKTVDGIAEATEATAGHASFRSGSESDGLSMNVESRTEFDGWTGVTVTLKAADDMEIKNASLLLPLSSKQCKYFMGLGLEAQKTPANFSTGWSRTPANSKYWPFDSFWTGNVDGGLQAEFRGSSYTGPMLNLYHPEFPASWYNDGKGGFTVKGNGNTVNVTAYSGQFSMKAGEEKTFEFAILATPVKELDTYSQFANKYYHNAPFPDPTDEDVETGVRLINVHHSNIVNPYINYPFLACDTLSRFVNHWHDKGCKVKMYYTLRELTTATYEIWAFRSLGDELLASGKGGDGYCWLQEHMCEGYRTAWFQMFSFENKDGDLPTADAAVVTSPGETRLFNYYVEGLKWLVKNLDIDGLYLDDVSYDRRTLKRMRRVMDSVKSGCLIDLHSNTGFSMGPANQYTEFFPYIDKVWFGESFRYDEMTPENYLVESSGIPFGLTGDMLQGGGNKWLGMQYGMTVRYPWTTDGVTCDPRLVWKIWDEFGIKDSKMIGFWEDEPLVTSTDPDVKVTSYLKEDGSLLLSLGNYSTAAKTVRLIFNTPDFKGRRLVAPEVEAFQPAQEWALGDAVTVDPKRGWLIYVK